MDIEDLGGTTQRGKHEHVVKYEATKWASIDGPSCIAKQDPDNPNRVLLPSESHTLGEWLANQMMTDRRVLSCAYVRSPSSIVVHLAVNCHDPLANIWDAACVRMIEQLNQLDAAIRRAL